MIAIIENWGKQYKVSEWDVVVLEKMHDVKKGDKITIKEVLLTFDEKGNTEIGTPFVWYEVKVEVVEAMDKADKIRVVKWKSKKRYSRVQWHRQLHTNVKVISITKKVAKVAKVEKESKAVVKKAPVKKAVSKKSPETKASVKK